MNILQQEDLVKGLPDQALMQQAQMPTGELPQFLVVSEIQRREKMRKSFSEAVPENSIKDQVLSSGIAAMNPTPDPLMASAMGAQSPSPQLDDERSKLNQLNQMFQGQREDIPLGVDRDINDPFRDQRIPKERMQEIRAYEQMQQGQPIDPMMQQQMMSAAGGGMMPYRMNKGTDTPNLVTDPRIAYYSMLESVKRTIDSGELDADGMNQFMGAIGNKMRGVTAEDYYQIVDYLRASGHDVSKIPSSRFDRRDSVNMESLQSRYGVPTETPEPIKPSSSQEEMSQIDAQYEAEYGESIKDKEAQQQFYRSDIPVAKEFEDDIPAVSLVEDNRSVADMFAGVQPKGLETMMPQRSGARSMLPGLEMSTEMMTETGLDSMVRNYQNDSMPRITSLLDSSEKIAPTFATTKAPNKNNYLSQFQRAETLLAELDRTRKETDEAGLPRSSVDSNAMREDLAKGVDLAGLRESYPDTEDATLLKYITAKEAGTTKVNERVEERQAAEALDVVDEMSNALYEIQKGDTLYGLSRERGTTVDDIMALNPQITDADRIYAGDTLNLSGGGITPHRMYGGLGSKVPSSYDFRTDTGEVSDNQAKDFIENALLEDNPISNPQIPITGEQINRYLKQVGVTRGEFINANPDARKRVIEAMNTRIGEDRVRAREMLRVVDGGRSIAQDSDRRLESIRGPIIGPNNPLRGKLFRPTGSDLIDPQDFSTTETEDAANLASKLSNISDTGIEITGEDRMNLMPRGAMDNLDSADEMLAGLISSDNSFTGKSPLRPNVSGNDSDGFQKLFNASAFDAMGANVNSNLLGTPKEFTPKSIDFSNLRSLLGEPDIDYKNMGVDYKGLLANEEARSKLASEEARRDAGSNALIQLGAGIAAGDLSKGLSKAGAAAMLGKKDARAEDRSLSALKRQIELADRTQESTLGIKSAEEGRKNREKLVGFEIEVQKEAIKTNKSVYDAYIQYETLRTAREKLPDEEQKRLDKELTQSSINYRNAMAESLDDFSDLDLDAYVKTAMAGDVNLQLTLSALSDSKKREWARTQIANGAIPGMAGGVGSSDSSNAAGYKLLSN